ncbi:hypothetical protein [Nonomuraea basaltis]|uniref:hypothetical protein n=1 Tax=Nonomuraea basaltis TaxID=2495887 RepID=UPI00110C4771|nr:hypothetical protein [Nonomuraea basaltis]TMR97564.1 hypothetical protein EJK15_17760 [Nonomuraea basaltis]
MTGPKLARWVNAVAAALASCLIAAGVSSVAWAAIPSTGAALPAAEETVTVTQTETITATTRETATVTERSTATTTATATITASLTPSPVVTTATVTATPTPAPTVTRTKTVRATVTAPPAAPAAQAAPIQQANPYAAMPQQADALCALVPSLCPPATGGGQRTPSASSTEDAVRFVVACPTRNTTGKRLECANEAGDLVNMLPDVGGNAAATPGTAMSGGGLPWQSYAGLAVLALILAVIAWRKRNRKRHGRRSVRDRFYSSEDTQATPHQAKPGGLPKGVTRWEDPHPTPAHDTPVPEAAETTVLDQPCPCHPEGVHPSPGDRPATDK